MARNRVIYQSEALYVSPNATGYHFASGGAGVNDLPVNERYDGVNSGSLVEQLTRVQTANYSFSINRQDINEFGKLARIDSIVLEPPTVTLDFSYYLTNGRNEALLDFPIDGTVSAASGHLQSRPGQNFFIQTAQEGSDAQGLTASNHLTSDSICVGNGFLSDYSIEASVGSIPTATVTIEGFNIISDTGTQNLSIPAVDLQDGTPITEVKFSLPPATGGALSTSDDTTAESPVSALRPGDVNITISSDATLMSDPLSFHIQSVNLSLPLSRSPIDRLGSRFAFTRVVDFPITTTMSVNALVADLKSGNLANILDDETEYTLTVDIDKSAADGGGDAMRFEMRGAKLDNESFSSDIGSNKTVDLTFTSQIGGPEDQTKGVFISGSFNGHANTPSNYSF